MRKKTIRDIDVSGKRVLLRVDYNVQVADGGVLNDLRLRESLDTIRALRDAGASIVICSHRGRPDGQVVESLRNAPVAAHLSRLLQAPVATCADCVGPEAEAAAAALGAGDILLLENVRFHAEEEADDAQFAQRLARLADIYVNDAFGTAHRAHASIVGVPRYLPAVAGLLMERELGYLERVTVAPEHPFVLLLGGSKMADKIGILRHLCDLVDIVCLGGGLANTFLMARGVDVQDSLVEKNRLEDACEIMRLLEERGRRLLLPVDAVVAHGAPEGGSVNIVPVEHVPSGWRILDIGPQTVETFAEALHEARTAVWNGPVGMFEHERTARGSLALAQVFAELSAVTVIGGGETVAAVERAGVAERISHLSTGGGASLAVFEGRPLPAVEALIDA